MAASRRLPRMAPELLALLSLRLEVRATWFPNREYLAIKSIGIQWAICGSRLLSAFTTVYPQSGSPSNSAAYQSPITNHLSFLPVLGDSSIFVLIRDKIS
jgi:hypothetical protein